jgi:putative hydrolase of the HAD superfamily
VLIEMGGVASLQEMAGSVGSEHVWHRWLTSPWVRSFETGDCSPAEFSVGFVAEWDLEIEPDRFLEIYRSWPIGPYPGTAEVLTEVQQRVQIGCLSNTNALHWSDQIKHWPFLELFDFRFLSFELGLVKPDAAIFRAAADRLPCRPERVLYLDDVALNSDAARSFGFRSERVQGLDEATRVLREFGIPISG